MTDKQIIIDGKIKPITLEDVPTILELHKSKSFVEIAKMYGVTQNAIRYWVKKYNVKPLKQKDQIKILEEQLKRAEKTMQEIWDRLGKTSDELLRKEQECETLASQLDFEVQKKECLEQECKELKIYIESNEQQVKEVETLVMDNDRLINELDQLKQTLTEIKEIAKGIAKSTYDSYPYGGDVETWEAQRAKQILQKISEVEDEN